MPASNAIAIKLAERLVALRNRYFILFDLLTFCVTPLAALSLRLDGLDALPRYAASLAVYAALAIAVRFVVFRLADLYSRYWRYASVGDLLQIIYAVAITTIILTTLAWLLPLTNLAVPDLPRSIPLIDGLLVFIATSGTRFSIRLAEQLRQHSARALAQSTRVAIFGAGVAGTMLVREMRQNPRLGLEPVAFFDTDPSKHHTHILGVPVIGDRSKLADAVKTYRIQQVIIAMPSAPGKTIRDLTHLCRDLKLPVKTMPGLSELLSGKLAVSQIRPVEITDLLRRAPVQIEMDEIARLLQDKRVLITGAGGSIGSELCRQIARCAPAEIILLGHGENSIFEIRNELEQILLPTAHRPLSTVSAIADIRDRERVCSIFRRTRPQIVFHAAAHKHVSLMEENIEEAITNNVLGTRNLLECALETNVAHFVLISTDKAVNPTSVMGATKRIAEMLVQAAAARTQRNFVAVRFGNVLDSRGSVVPLFKKQIAAGGPITITHPNVRRFFMTIPEAVRLVLQTTVLAQPGAIYVLDMSEPVKIVDLANDLIRLSGLTPDDIEIKFIGLRPGEKLYEELFASGEAYAQTSHPKIFVAQNREHSSIANGQLPIEHCLDALIAAAQRGEPAEVRQRLREIVPEYQPTDHHLPISNL